MSIKPTTEQEAIIHHPLGKHARVLAVAGSGKTTTMVHRVHHLVMDRNQDPTRIRIVMFNRLARLDFEKKLAEAIFDTVRRPKVLTFHALAYGLRREAEKQGLLARYTDLWTGDREELALICMHRAIDSLLQEGLIEDDVDPIDALDAVGLWKASLIPPERAGHRTNLDLPLVYRRFEEYREEARALTFDDFVPKAMELMEGNPRFRKLFVNKLDHLIVDEYQDINYGQQELIRLLAGSRADVMVVGDDDQTIYEWRAARPHYILEGFKEDFCNKPVVDYQLSHSFRFGPLVAQAAYNTIRFNQHRESKPLVSHFVDQDTGIDISVDESEQASQISLNMAREVSQLVRQERVPPEKIAVLGRIFVQLESLQAAFIRGKIPFRVLGMGAFFERDENRTLVDYIRLALAWNQTPDAMRPWRAPQQLPEEEESAQARSPGRYQRLSRYSHSPYGEAVRTVLAIANTPSRKLARIHLQKAVERGGQAGWSLGRSIEELLDERQSPLPAERREALQELVDLLQRIAERVAGEPELKAGDLLAWIVDNTDYRDHFERYYGEGMASFQRLKSVDNFLAFASGTGMPVLAFLRYLETLDPTLGLDEKKVITMTTVHRTKGLEFDYVFIPECIEGHMPVHLIDDVGVYDKEGQVPDHPPSPPLESERRLFYVAVTRAIKHVYIGTAAPPPTGQQLQSTTPLPSRFLEEIQLDPTQELLAGFQRSLRSRGATSQEVDDAALRQTLTQWAGHHSLIRYISEYYLPRLDNEELVAAVDHLVQKTSEIPFQYRYQYPDLGGLRKPVEQEPEPPPWSDPWAGIGTTL